MIVLCGDVCDLSVFMLRGICNAIAIIFEHYNNNIAGSIMQLFRVTIMSRLYSKIYIVMTCNIKCAKVC